MIQEIWDYFNKEQVRAIDVVFLSLLTSFFLWIINFIFKKLVKLMSPRIGKLKKIIELYYKLIFKNVMNGRYLVALERRLAAGGKLKWYETKAYNKFKEEIRTYNEEHKEEISKLETNLTNQVNHLNNEFKNFR
ncbi:hypothetical protein [Paenibacillus sp. XY044]|uniref:hypothetical protein n=1 Tax=Paenibacillus sp. XY044 TaxID=2026089 RepID=UPI000B982CDB|nr:hypothetical protein [Paenibacillus sp. XY044]OZB98124.1 hypothetical protein CJP46_02850 [Paenibacillus sp. XY044]